MCGIGGWGSVGLGWDRIGDGVVWCGLAWGKKRKGKGKGKGRGKGKGVKIEYGLDGTWDWVCCACCACCA